LQPFQFCSIIAEMRTPKIGFLNVSVHSQFISCFLQIFKVQLMFIQWCWFNVVYSKKFFFLVFLKLLFPVGSFGFDCFKSRHTYPYCWISLKQVKHSFLINLIATLKSVFCIPRSHRLNKMTGSNKNPFQREEKI
jgi:hypothetical protein